MTVGAPAAHDVHEYDLAFETSVRLGDPLTVKAQRREAKGLGWVLHARPARWVGRLRQVLTARLAALNRRVASLSVLQQRECAVRELRYFEQHRASSGEMAE